MLSNNTESITNLYDRFQYKGINCDSDTENGNINSDVQYEQYENNISVQCEDMQSISDRQSDPRRSESNSQSSLNISCDKSSDLNFDDNENGSSFEDDVAVWAVEHHISHTALNALLLMLRKHSCFSTLCVDARTLLKTPKQQNIYSCSRNIVILVY